MNETCRCAHALTAHSKRGCMVMSCSCTRSREEQSAEDPVDTRGWHEKFEVTRTDGSSAPGQRHAECEYFVLDLAHDPDAKVALLAYAVACRTLDRRWPTTSLRGSCDQGARVPLPRAISPGICSVRLHRVPEGRRGAVEGPQHGKRCVGGVHARLPVRGVSPARPRC